MIRYAKSICQLEIHLTMKIIFIPSTNKEEKHLIYSKSNGTRIIVCAEASKVIVELFDEICNIRQLWTFSKQNSGKNVDHEIPEDYKPKRLQMLMVINIYSTNTEVD